MFPIINMTRLTTIAITTPMAAPLSSTAQDGWGGNVSREALVRLLVSMDAPFGVFGCL
jgi:hypothetical protein